MPRGHASDFGGSAVLREDVLHERWRPSQGRDKDLGWRPARPQQTGSARAGFGETVQMAVTGPLVQAPCAMRKSLSDMIFYPESFMKSLRLVLSPTRSKDTSKRAF